MPLRACLRLLAACTLAACLSTAAADERAAFVSYLDELRSFSAAFSQQRFDEDGELLETAHGQCDIERPGRFRWLYTEPYAQTIVSDGAHLWIYDQDLEQVTVNPVSAGAEGTPAELLSAEFAVDSRYLIEHLGPRDGYDWFLLTPKGPATEFQKIELGFADGEVKAMRLQDNLQQTTLLEFAEIKRNVELEDALFHFEPPPGIDVIEGAAP